MPCAASVTIRLFLRDFTARQRPHTRRDVQTGAAFARFEGTLLLKRWARRARRAQESAQGLP
jgi:hypothetical protein